MEYPALGAAGRGVGQDCAKVAVQGRAAEHTVPIVVGPGGKMYIKTVIKFMKMRGNMCDG